MPRGEFGASHSGLASKGFPYLWAQSLPSRCSEHWLWAKSVFILSLSTYCVPGVALSSRELAGDGHAEEHRTEIVGRKMQGRVVRTRSHAHEVPSWQGSGCGGNPLTGRGPTLEGLVADPGDLGENQTCLSGRWGSGFRR